MKLRWLFASVALLGIGAAHAQDTTSEKGKLSYAIGYQLGREMAERGVDLDVATVVSGVQEGFAKRDPSVPPEEMRAAVEKMQEQLLTQARAEFERVSAENEQFLTANRAKQGIQNLASGIQYRIIEQGTGPQPTAESTVQIHFRGSLTTGQEFASTYTGNEAVSMKISEAPLPGLREILPMMKVGSRWEVFLPSDMAYGDSPRSPIGPGQAAVFDVKLVSMN
jgi:FKBP-type peptidyl-prolyl cis-trans isomerase